MKQFLFLKCLSRNHLQHFKNKQMLVSYPATNALLNWTLLGFQPEILSLQCDSVILHLSSLSFISQHSYYIPYPASLVSHSSLQYYWAQEKAGRTKRPLLFFLLPIVTCASSKVTGILHLPLFATRVRKNLST